MPEAEAAEARLPSLSRSPPMRKRVRQQQLRSWCERPELIADEVHRRNEHDRDRLRDDLGEPERDEHVEDEQVCTERERGDDQEPQALVRDVTSLSAERPEPVPRVVVRDRDQERADGRRDVVGLEAEVRARRRVEKTQRFTA